jgi:predicted double-glycine peptidase
MVKIYNRDMKDETKALASPSMQLEKGKNTHFTRALCTVYTDNTYLESIT